MANKKISELASSGALTGAELVEVVQGGTNVKTTTQDIANLIGGGGTWGSITGTVSDQIDLQNALNDKSDAGATIVTDTGAYTLQASDLTLINAGATLIIDGDATDNLTVPLNATVAFPVGAFIGVRDYNNIVATGGVTITGTSGDLTIPSGMTVTLEKTGTDTWILHNGSAAITPGDTLTTEGALINSATSKATPVDADYVGLMDSAASNILKKLSWSNIKATLKTYFDTLYAPLAGSKVYPAAVSDETTSLTTGAAKLTFRMPYAMTLTAVRASLNSAQTSGSTFTVDINASGTTILSTKITIDNNEKTSVTASTPAVISDSSLSDDEEITIDIDQIGNGTAAGLKIVLIGY